MTGKVILQLEADKVQRILGALEYRNEGREETMRRLPETHHLHMIDKLDKHVDEGIIADISYQMKNQPSGA